MPLEGLNHYTIRPFDLERTRSFYVDLLGLEVVDRCPKRRRSKSVELSPTR